MLAAIETQNLTRRFGAVTALDGVSLSIAKGEFFSLLGPSGCGKTTLLRLIAGLDLPDAGTLCLNGKDAAGMPAHERPVNTVFQSYALFPHLNVRENVAFGLRMKKVPAAEITPRVARVLEMADIGPLAERRPGQLSGGQRQRVALARAIINEPEVLLLDEPLGALDLKLRRQLQIELRQLQRRLGITFVYVTHDQEEAMAMSDRIAVMNRGRVEQIGAPGEIYDRPRTRFAAEFLGSCNLLKGAADGRNVNTMFGQMSLETDCGRTEINLTVRPENLHFGNVGAAGKIVAIVYSGAQTHYEVQVNGQTLKAFILNTHGGEKFAVGQAVSVSVRAGALRVLED